MAAIVAGCGDSGHDVVPTGSAIFDPCEDISDDLFREAGFDPATKEKPSSFFPDRCTVGRGVAGLLILEHNTSPGDMSAYELGLAFARNSDEQVEVTRVNGRDAYTESESIPVLDTKIPSGCGAHLRTKAGKLRISLSVDGPEPCAQALRVATVLEPSIGSHR
ncbi:DUF3558 domain-containing protein [Nocardia otitidiscaviarum]|uniref:hypothetical protein n=1 Tax=Nocardia otitidiscaviarum TaxID=1823 RepID=UPI0018951130|nr:hypothetical protein [Nocardia otitidiscaviarum]MBF6183131.1 hypothetical protein [Nocardia otitidiscaviarum]